MEATWNLSPKLSFPNHVFQCLTKDHLLQLLKVYMQIKVNPTREQVLLMYV